MASTSLTNIIDSLSGAAASWYTALNPASPVIVPGNVTQQYAAIQAQQAAQIGANQIQAQQALTRAAPVASGLLANPTVLILIAIAAVLLIVVVLKR